MRRLIALFPPPARWGFVRRSLVALFFATLLAGIARADIPPGPSRHERPSQPAKESDSGPASPQSPAPAGKACGMGMGLVILVVGTVAALRLSKARPAKQGTLE